MQSTEKKAIYNQDITQKRGTVENKRLEKNNRMNWDWHEILELLLDFQKVKPVWSSSGMLVEKAKQTSGCEYQESIWNMQNVSLFFVCQSARTRFLGVPPFCLCTTTSKAHTGEGGIFSWFRAFLLVTSLTIIEFSIVQLSVARRLSSACASLMA